MKTRQHALISLLLVAAITAPTTWFVVSQHIRERVAETTEVEIDALDSTAERISGFLAATTHVLQSLPNETLVTHVLDNPAERSHMLADILYAIAARNPDFEQLRWIDERGQERVRIERDGEKIQMAPLSRLQDKSDHYYFSDAMRLMPGQIYYSPLDLNIEQGRVSLPYRPTVRVATKVADSSGKNHGIIIINHAASSLLQSIGVPNQQAQVLVANAYGDWLKGFKRADEWGFMFGQRRQVSDYTEEGWRAMSLSRRGSLHRDGGIWMWSTIDAGRNRWGDSRFQVYGAPVLKVIGFIPGSFVQSIVSDEWRRAVGPALGVSLVIALVLTAFLRIRDKHHRVSLRLAESEKIRAMEQELITARARAQSLVEGNVNGILIVDSAGAIVMTNPALDQLFGFEPGELIGLPLESLVPDRQASAHRVQRRDFSADPTRTMMIGSRPILGKRKGGDLIPVEVSLSPVPGSSRMEIAATVIDIRARVKAEQHLRNLARAFQNSGEAIFIVDSERHIVNVNTMFSKLTGYSEDEVIGTQPNLFESDPLGADKSDTCATPAGQSGCWRGEQRVRRRDGTGFPVWLTISDVRDDDDSIGFYVYSFSDVSEIKKTQAQLEQLAHHDILTGLPNRVLLAQQVHHALARAKRRKDRFALIFIDLDNFKHINDALGHAAGDQVLQQVAQILATHLRDEDTVARIGGDEFVILLEDIREAEVAALLAEKLLGYLDAPFHIEGETLHVTASLGICVYPNDGEDYETLLRHADAAMYRAKEDGKNGYHLYTEDLAARSANRLRIETALHQAIERDEMFLVYQPQFDLDSGKLVGVEALLRWNHPTRGLVGPGEFMPIAEQSGLFMPLERWIMQTACQQASDWIARGLDFGRMAINLSGSRIQRGELPEEVMSVLQISGCPASRIELEIAETFIMHRAAWAVEEFEALRDLGITLAIDDFGTGYSSLAYLRKLPVDKLKIDQSFVRDIGSSHGDRQIVSAVTAMGRSLGLTVVAEGVELEEQAAFLRSEGCNHVQGFLFGKPLAAIEFERRFIDGPTDDDSRRNIIPLPRRNGVPA